MTRPHPVELLQQSAVWDTLDGGSLVVACSGGRDSVALALAAVELLADPRFTRRFRRLPELVLWHFDHGLREDSWRDRQFVVQLATQLSVRCRVDQMSPFAAPGNMEASARRERYAILLEFLHAGVDDFALRKPARAVTAHHLQDQAETLLHNLLRGTRLKGARGIAAKLSEDVFRPWLSLPPEAIEDYLTQKQQVFCTDPTNQDLRLTRNWLRHEVLPRLIKANPNTLQHLAEFVAEAQRQYSISQAAISSLEVTYCSAAQVSSRLPLLFTVTAGYAAYRASSPFTASVQLYNFVLDELGPWLRPTPEQLARLYTWSLEPAGRLNLGPLSLELPHPHVLIFEAAVPATIPAIRVDLTTGAEYCVEGWMATLAPVSLGEAPQPGILFQPAARIHSFRRYLSEASVSGDFDSRWDCYLPHTTALPLRLRTWRAGDRMQLPGGGTKKVGDIFTDAKLPLVFRPAWALLVDAADTVIWVPALADSATMHHARTKGAAWQVSLRRQL